MLNLVRQMASNKKVTWKKRLNQFYDTAPSSTFDSQTRIEHLQPKANREVPRSDVLVLGLRPGAIPRHFGNIGLKKSVH
jgi:hypothetical protein